VSVDHEQTRDLSKSIPFSLLNPDWQPIFLAVVLQK